MSYCNRVTNVENKMDREQELESFKTDINLIGFATSQGYEIDGKESSRNSATMKNAAGDKIIIGRAADGHWIYFSVRDDTDHGSIIDFTQRRGGGSLGEVRKQLREHLSTPPAPPVSSLKSLEPLSRDLVKVRAAFSAMRPMESCKQFLEQVRGIPSSVLDSNRFDGRILSDDFSNAIFPHWNAEGLSGYEIKNENFTGFAPGGQKGLWGSRTRVTDKTLVVAETAIDALSYAALFGFERCRFVSTAGQLNPEQPELLKRAAAKMIGPNAEIVLAFDNDKAGHALAENLTPILGEFIPCRLHFPATAGKDWNDTLRERG